MRRLAALLLLIGAALGVALAVAGPASAHATVVTSTPADGSRLASAPANVTITFDESVGLGSGGYLHVVDQAGRRVDSAAAIHPGGAGSKVEVTLKSGLGEGTFTASFRVISADSHPVAGAIRFVVGNGALGAAASTPSAVNPTTNFVYQVVRWTTFAGLAVLGGGWLLLTVWSAGRDDRGARRLLWSGWGLAVAGAVAETLLQGPYAAGAGLSALRHWTLLDATLHTTFGTAHATRLVLLGLLGGAITLLLRDLERSRIAEVAGLLTAGVVITYAASGHASAQNPRWLAMLSDSVHLAAMSAWIGGLAFLLVAVLPRRDPDELGEVLPTFSRVAYTSVAVLALTGTYQAWLGVGSWDALATTRYGQLVLVKIGLFLGLIALGNLSRVAIQRRYVRPVAFAMTTVDAPVEPLRVGRMRRSVLVEAVIAMVIFGVTAVLVAEPPGRAAVAAADAKARNGSIQLGAGKRADLVVDPGRHGTVTVTLSLVGVGKPQSITLSASLPAQQLGPISMPLTAEAGSTYNASNVNLPVAGNWEFDLVVQTSQFDSTTANTTIRLH